MTKQKKTTLHWIPAFLFVLLVALLSIHDNGLWGDEACRVWHPQFTFSEYFSRAVGFGQIGYLMYTAIWSSLFGLSEVALRCSNIPFALLAAYYVLKIVKKTDMPNWSFALFFIHPMFTYYMNEVTPYIVVYAFSLAFIYYIFFFEDTFNDMKHLVRINSVFLAGVFFHFMFGFIYVLYLYKCIVLLKHRQLALKTHIKCMLLFMIAYIPLLAVICYGLFTNSLIRGEYTIKNVAFILYGFGGFMGLALSRNDLRAGNFSMLTGAQLGCAVALAALYGLIIVLARKSLWAALKPYAGLFISALACFIFLNGVSALIQFRVWERHSMFLFPVWIMLVCLSINALSDGGIKKALLAGLLCLMLFSCFNLRSNYYYCYDDFKGVQASVHKYADEVPIDTIYTSIVDNYGFYSLEEAVAHTAAKIEYITGSLRDIKQTITDNPEGKYLLILEERALDRDSYQYFDQIASRIDTSCNSYKILLFE